MTYIKNNVYEIDNSVLEVFIEEINIITVKANTLIEHPGARYVVNK